MKARLAAVAGVAAAALAAPAAADASGISVGGTCFVTGQAVPITVFGFTAGTSVSISGDASGSTVADASGNIAASVSAPFVNTVAPKTITITATDGANSANVAGARFPVVARVFNTNAPLTGRPRQKTTWRF